MAQARRTQQQVMVVHMVLAMVHQLVVAMEVVVQRMVVVMVDMVQLATNKPHCGRFGRGVCFSLYLLFF